MSRRLAVRAVILHNEKLLCVRLKAYSGEIATNHYCLPGGALDEGEALTAGLHREMMEETNVPPQIGNLLYINHFRLNEREHIEFFFHVTNAEDYLKVDLSTASHAEEEIAELDFVDPSNTHILPEFLTTEPLAEAIDSPQPTKIFTYFD